ncbi:MAG TPA: flagellar hook-length control protein FliK [Gammaproteobacteria bacterium]|nr:flagellar hook-length control protein FliK [Gammaproteobacteria bacterium]
MEITRPSAAASQLPSASGAWTRSLQLGQLLAATVVTTSESGPHPLLLRIAGRLIYAQSPTPLPQLKPGQVLQLRVESLGTLPVLKLVEEGSRGDPVGSALRALLPRQGNLEPLLATWSTMARGAENLALAPSSLQRLVRELFGRLADERQIITADGLRRALGDSGLFLESRLLQATGDGTPAGDLKASLLRLLAILTRTSPNPQGTPSRVGSGAGPDTATGNATTSQDAAARGLLASVAADNAPVNNLRGEAEGALARIQLHQLAALPRADGTTQWLFHLPVRQGDQAHLLELQVNREGTQRDGGGTTGPRWSVLLHLDLPQLGPVHARIELRGEQVNTRLWAERPATFHRLQHFLPRLQDGLARAGLEVTGLACQCGRGPRPTAAYPDAPVLDLKA